MPNSRSILQELYWAGIIFVASYIIVSINSSFHPLDLFLVCERGGIYLKNISVIIQLTILLVFVRLVFKMTMTIESQAIKYFFLPLVVIALPVALIIVWLQFLGC
jgi:hypothetical protein